MENASRALIIAGSVLISLLVIAALVFMFNQVSDLRQTQEDASMEDKLQSFYANLDTYIDGNKRGNDILSLAINATLKEGSNPQRVIVQTYNYNLATGEEVKLEEILSQKNLVQSEVQNKINETIQKAKQEAEIMVQSGYPVYNRDLTSEIYKLSNISNYCLGPNGNLYIIFAYGNQNHTSAMDIVLYE